jgi:hypothetical protein
MSAPHFIALGPVDKRVVSASSGPLGGVAVDDQRQLRGLLDRKVGRLGAVGSVRA